MNLLIDEWLPVRLLEGGTTSWISLAELLTGKKEYEICLPRDDLEMAALQLLICMVQNLFIPENLEGLVDHIRKPMAEQTYFDGIEAYKEWFELEHPEHPFMQVRGVKANKKTPMHRLLPGLADATNSCFVNEQGIADSLCGGCSAVSIFNRATNSPSFGGGTLGGFKPGLRGSIPITTLIQGRHLREMVWLNVLSKEFIADEFLQNLSCPVRQPTWVSKIKKGSKINAYEIGLLRGLMWQPALIELGQPVLGSCNLCGKKRIPVFNYFLTNQLGYKIEGVWHHPHSPSYLELKKGVVEQQFASFKNSAPGWTQLARFVVKQPVDNHNKEGQEPASVIMQANKLFGRNKERITLAIGGYRNEPGKSASIAERRHEILSLNQGWTHAPHSINEMVKIGVDYKKALTAALFVFDNGLRDKKQKRNTHKGLGFSKKKIQYSRIGESQFFHRTDGIMQKALAEAHFEYPDQLAVDKDNLRSILRSHCRDIFEEQTGPYLNDPELIRTMAVARRTLHKHLKELEPDIEGGDS
jgi:CRISPR system Cascade subunit CasA